jgi:hypothetical protein
MQDEGHRVAPIIENGITLRLGILRHRCAVVGRVLSMDLLPTESDPAHLSSSISSRYPRDEESAIAKGAAKLAIVNIDPDEADYQ